MINSKKQLKYFLERDKIALKKSNKSRPSIFGDEIWKFEHTMRKLEYLSSLKGLNVNFILFAMR